MKIVLVVAINLMQHFQPQRHSNSPRVFIFFQYLLLYQLGEFDKILKRDHLVSSLDLFARKFSDIVRRN